MPFTKESSHVYGLGVSILPSDFGNVPTVWYFRNVPTVWYFRNVPTVWYFRNVPMVFFVPFYCSLVVSILIKHHLLKSF
jgi:hypothetical protein